MITRHKAAIATRNFMNDQDFIEIETPVLMKSTPEGARDFLVPSRLHSGRFYALASITPNLQTASYGIRI